MVTDYDSLKTEIANYVSRKDVTGVIDPEFDARLPTFIQFVGAEVARRLRVHDQYKSDTVSTEAGEPDYALPTDFGELKAQPRFTDINWPGLKFLTASEMQNRPAGHIAGTPLYYTLLGDTIRLGPVPDAVLTLELQYFADIPELDETTTTNWLLDGHPDIYLHGALHQAHIYLGTPAKIRDKSEVAFEKALNELIRADTADHWSGPPLRKRNRYDLSRIYPNPRRKGRHLYYGGS